MENKTHDYLWKWILIMFFALVALAILVTAFRVEWMTEEDSDKIINLLEGAEKKAIVSDVKHEVLKWPKYTIRVWYEWARKPIPKLTGLTIDTRSKQLLDTVWIGHTLPIWRKFGKEYGIDYTFPIAIAFADSHLWKALKSRNNLGNIWNNDRWDIQHFDSLESWIEAIFWTLAKWKYMSGHTTIWTLSGEGRKHLNLKSCTEETDYRKKCYATSMWVWSTNVVNIMSAMHDKQIDENYNFRLK